MFQQGEGAPPTIFPTLPVNIPGNQAPVTLVNGPIAVAPTNPAPALASKTTVPLGPPTSVDPVFDPPIVLEVDPVTL